MRSTATAALVALAAITACATSTPTFSVSNAIADYIYTCPAGADNAPYPLHVSVDAHNPTSSAVAIRSVKVALKLDEVKGSWLEKVGDTYDAGSATFTPGSIAAGAAKSLLVTASSACTRAKSSATGPSYGEYLVTLHIETSAGSYTLVTTNRHRLVA
jgi:hypothetical protein